MDGRRTDTKERILKTAVDFFAEHGIRGASIRDICQAVGVRESAFYKHFASKNALVAAVYAAFAEFLAKPFISAEDLTQLLERYSVADLIWGACRGFLRPADDLYTRMWLIMMGEQFHNPEAAILLEKEAEGLVGKLEKLFRLLEEAQAITIENHSVIAERTTTVLMQARERICRRILLHEETEELMKVVRTEITRIIRIDGASQEAVGT